ncbi:MAG: hypothetical protein ACI4TM_03095, partial [Candidatus Cryptobacteroides sp.]
MPEAGSVVSGDGAADRKLFDKQGNEIDADGKLVVSKLQSVDEITDEDFSSPTRSVQLPKIPDNVDAAIGANGKPVIIKKNIFARNNKFHPEVTASQAREILATALYSPDLYGQNQKTTRPYNWIVINTKDAKGQNRLVVLEVNDNKDNVEIVHWYVVDDRGVEKVKRQAVREGGHILILPSEKEEAGTLSGRTSSLPSDDKGKKNSGENNKDGRDEKGNRVASEAADSNDGIKLQKSGGQGAVQLSEDEAALRDALVDTLNASGIEVVTDTETGQAVLDEANGVARQAKKTAPETASVTQGAHQPTVVSSAAGAKILNNLDNAIADYDNKSNYPKEFIGDVAAALGAKRDGSGSEYATFETVNGKIVTIRLANHNAKVSNFDNRDETEGISIVISPKPNEGMTDDGNAHIVEYYYNAIKLRKAKGKPLADIVKSIKQSLYSGEFNDTTGLAERQEVNENNPRLQKATSGIGDKAREVWDKVSGAISFLTGKSKGEVKEDLRKENLEIRKQTKELYEKVLKGDFDEVTLRLIDEYINNVTPENPYRRPLSKRLPQAVGRRMRKGERTNSVDALFTRISESAVREAGSSVERTRARRAIEEKKKELLKGWAIATGNWHTSVSDFTDNTEPIGKGKDSVVYSSSDGKSVIKASFGKNEGKKFSPDIDAVTLFNFVFPNSRYEILGYGEIDGKFVKFLKQPAVEFADVPDVSVQERVEYMRKLGFEPINKEKTAFSNGELVVADVQKGNIVKDANGNIRVIDADVKLHTRDIGGNYTYPPAETDTDTTLRLHKVYHGTAANFDKFDFSHMGKGEGFQAYGYGAYVTDMEGIGRHYASVASDVAYREGRLQASAKDFVAARLSSIMDADPLMDFNEAKAKLMEEDYGSESLGEDSRFTREDVESFKEEDLGKYGARILYTVEIPENTGKNYLTFEKNLKLRDVRRIYDALYEKLINDEESGYSGKMAAEELRKELDSLVDEETTGNDLYGTISSYLGSDKEASAFLNEMGYAGISYP